MVAIHNTLVNLYNYYSGTFRKRPPLMSGLGGHLWEVVIYGRWSLRGSFTDSNLTEEPMGILVRWSLKRSGPSGRFYCSYLVFLHGILCLFCYCFCS